MDQQQPKEGGGD
jgi:hypothetical protein